MKHDKKDILGKLKNSGTGFNLPEGYFDSLDDKIIEGMITAEGSKKTGQPPFFQKDTHKAGGLIKIGKKSGFKVPQGYFDQDEAYLIRSTEKRIFSIPINKNKMMIWYSVAATFLLFFAIKYVTVTPSDFDLSEINQSDIETWIDDDLVSFNSYDLSEVFDEIDLNDHHFTDEEVETYIANEDIENIILQNETNE